jgi:Uma2 family endonuclease
MSTALLAPPTAGLLPTELQNGDRLTQPEFHALYRQTRDKFKAELIGGIVYVASPVKLRHAENHTPISAVFQIYEARTPGTRLADNATVLLGDDSEPQPDLHLRLSPEVGGRSAPGPDGYLVGPPELVCEISDSTRSVDLHAKKRDYIQAGVLEYLVLNLRDQKLHWFDLSQGTEMPADADGIIRVRCFPGLWIDSKALIERNVPRLLDGLNLGLSSPEHATFIERLASLRNEKAAAEESPRPGS